MSIKVSIIIPVYNSQQTLIPCISNLVHQTLKDIELIFINDCSSDNSLSILNDCYTQFPDITTIISTPENLGPGGARNLGLDIAKGEYIGFVDSDDLVDTSMFEKLYITAISNKYDIVDCGFYYEQKDINTLYTADEDTGVLTPQKREHLIAGGGYLWSKLIRRKLIEKHHLRFREKVILEDMDFLLYLFAVSYNIGNLHEVLYIYKNTNSSASKETDLEKYIFNIKQAMISIYKKMYILPNYTQLRLVIEYSIINLYSCGVKFCIKHLLNNSISSSIILEYLLELRQLKTDYVITKYKSNPYIQSRLSYDDYLIISANDTSPVTLIKKILS